MLDSKKLNQKIIDILNSNFDKSLLDNQIIGTILNTYTLFVYSKFFPQIEAIQSLLIGNKIHIDNIKYSGSGYYTIEILK